MKRSLISAGVVVLAITTAASRRVVAQTNSNWLPTGTANWNVDANWDAGGLNLVPEARFDEIAVIASGGTAQVTDTPPVVGGLAVNNGAVEIQSAGTLSVDVGFDALARGAVAIGLGGALTVASGATLNTVSLSNQGRLQLTGPAASVNVSEDFSTAGNTLVVQIDSGTFRPISVVQQANLSGALDVQFTGPPPTVGSRWNLVDAGTISGNFSSISVVGTGQLGVGQAFSVRQQAGGVHGTLAQLLLEQRLILQVDRQTGAASIQNPGNTAIELDGYEVQSAIGSIDPTSWNSLEDQAFDAGTWLQTGQGGLPSSLAELNPTSTSSLAAASSTPIGSIFAPNFTAFGVPTEDLVFTYTMPGADTIEGVVEYVGDGQSNNIVLTVDPDTGIAAMQNESPFAVSFDGYEIVSESGSLLAQDENWNSLQDQGAAGGNWFETTVNSTLLAELQTIGVTTLGTGEGFPLGTLFDTSGTRDLVFRFLTESEFLPTEGVVVYGKLPSPAGADFDNDGDIDHEDFLAWQMNFGTPAGTTRSQGDADGDGDTDGVDFLKWQAAFGGTAAAAATAQVPEPTTPTLLLVMLAGALATQRHKGRSLTPDHDAGNV